MIGPLSLNPLFSIWNIALILSDFYDAFDLNDGFGNKYYELQLI